MFRLIPIIILSIISLYSCKEGGSDVKSNLDSKISESIDAKPKNPLAQDEKGTLETKNTTSTTDSDNIIISFDEITLEEIRKNNSSDDGNNKKKPLVFTENGVEVEISNIFYLKSRSSRKIPTASPPNSLTGAFVILKVNGGSSFNFESAMIASLSTPKIITIKGTSGNESIYKEKIELTHTDFKKYEFGFKNIESLIIGGGINGAVFDDIEISLN